MSFEKVYVLGATGNIGTRLVKNLLSRGISTTIYVRNVEKSRSLFGTDANLTTVQGDYSDLAPFKATIATHTRLFTLATNVEDMVVAKTAVAEIAYAAGVQQIVDTSSLFVEKAWRRSIVGEAQRLAEEQIYALALKHGRAVVSLRPSTFFTNHRAFAGILRSQGVIVDRLPADRKVEYISPDDIADVASLVLTDPVEKHGNRAYALTGDSVDGATRAALFSKALGREITYKRVSAKEYYDSLVQLGYPSHLAYDVTIFDAFDSPNDVVPILLDRPYESLESWIIRNKALFQ